MTAKQRYSAENHLVHLRSSQRMANSAVTMAYTYNRRNLPLTFTNHTIGKTVGYTYDENGHPVTLSYPDGEVFTYTCDARGQVTRLESNQPGPDGEPAPVVEYTADVRNTSG